jgi:hypothetical protein
MLRREVTMSGPTPETKFVTCGVIVLTLLVVSCNRDTPMSPGSPLAPSPQVTTVRLDVSTAASLAPGARAELKATAILSDGSVRDVTDRTTFNSADTAVLQVSGAVVTGVGVGEARVNANHQAPDGTRYGSALVDVLLPGTFKLSGRIADSGIAVPDAVVTVRSGIGTGLTTRALSDGRYVLYGVSGRVGLELKRQGYRDAVVDVDVNRSLVRDLEMIPDRPRAVVSGLYTLTIDMGICDPASEAMPTALRHRQYTADVAQEDGRLTVTLGGADFIANRFTGAIDPLGRVTFVVGDPYDDYLIGPFDLVERVSATEVFVAWGTVAGTMTESGLRGALRGYLMVTDINYPTFFSASATCGSAMHLFALQRQ